MNALDNLLRHAQGNVPPLSAAGACFAKGNHARLTRKKFAHLVAAQFPQFRDFVHGVVTAREGRSDSANLGVGWHFALQAFPQRPRNCFHRDANPPGDPHRRQAARFRVSAGRVDTDPEPSGNLKQPQQRRAFFPGGSVLSLHLFFHEGKRRLIGKAMQRTSHKTVTPRYRRKNKELLPILIPSGDRHHDALATFFVTGLGNVGLRVLGPGDFDKMAWRGLNKKARAGLRELIALRQGVAEKGPGHWLRRFAAQKPLEEKFARKVRAALDLDIGKGGRPSCRTKLLLGEARLLGDPLSYLSSAITAKLSRARLVLWWKGQPRDVLPPPSESELLQRVAYLMYWRKEEQFAPAIFCPDMETAFYVYALFRMTGSGFGVCAQCGEVFQKTRPDLLYCCFSHGEAYRLRRWRAARKQKAQRRNE